MTDDYGMNAKTAVKILNGALATELVCTLRYRQHSFVAKGINSEPIAREFLVHANEELAHADLIAKRIVQLGVRRSSTSTGLRSCRMPNTEPATRWKR